MLVFFLIPVFCFACSQDYSEQRSKSKARVVKEFFKELDIEGLEPIGVGGGVDSKKKNRLIEFTFTYPHLIDVKKGRELIYNINEKFLSVARNDDVFSSFLEVSPIDPNILILSILPCKGNEIVSIRLMDEQISFYTDDGNEYAPYRTMHTESYQEAKKIIADQRTEG